MPTETFLTTKLLIDQTKYYATTGTFFGVALIAAAVRIFIRIHHLKRFNVEDYLFFVAVAAHIAGFGLSLSFIAKVYNAFAISKGKGLPPPNFVQDIEDAAQHFMLAEVLCWITIFAVKWSFLFYLRALICRMKKMEAWWWFVLMMFVPVTGMAISAPFIVCPHTGRSIFLYCQPTPTLIRRLHIWLYYTTTLDVATDIMLISIPVIVLHKSSFDWHRKFNIGILLCLSFFMIVIGFIRIIAASVMNANDHIWTSFWVQIEASTSVIVVCPTAFRTLFLIKSASKHTPNKYTSDQAHASVLRRIWRNKPTQASIKVRPILTGMKTMIRDHGQTQLGFQKADGVATQLGFQNDDGVAPQLGFQNDDGIALSSIEMQDTHPSQSLEATKRSTEVVHEVTGAVA